MLLESIMPKPHGSILAILRRYQKNLIDPADEIARSLGYAGGMAEIAAIFDPTDTIVVYPGKKQLIVHTRQGDEIPIHQKMDYSSN